MNPVTQLNSALTGRYDVEREIGAGGMATVYLARDVKHNRKVALKVLRPDLGAVLGVERFLSEIQVTANLQHPNLLPLFDSGEANGLLFYVMPFVDGESLRAKLDREKQLPVDEAVRISAAIASALGYAHEHGVIHRDLKPENILLQAGQPVIADFGIALAVSNAGGGRVTQTGISLGTPQYMSPEQATGDRTVDGRTDIYSLGAMTYEMLTGEPPHIGHTSQAIIARVLTEKPRSVRIARPNVPEHIDDALDRALEKLPADRFASAREFSEALNGRITALPGATSARRAAAARKNFLSRLPAPVLALLALVVGAALGIAGWIATRPAPKAAPIARLIFDFGDSTDYTPGAGVRLAISPQGTNVAYVGGKGHRSLYVRAMDAVEPTPIPKTEGASNIAFSRDGRWIIFTAGGSIQKVSIAGGPITTLTDGLEASWGDNDVIVVARARPNLGLWRTTPAGGPPKLIMTPDTARRDVQYTRPSVLPGAEAALVEIRRVTGADSSQLGVVRIATGELIRLGILGVNPRYVQSGHIVFGTLDNGVFAVPFDAKALKVTGDPVSVIDEGLVKGGGATDLAISDNGTLVYVRGARTDRNLEWIDRRGSVTKIPGLPAGQYRWARLSPDGKRLAAALVSTTAPGSTGRVASAGRGAITPGASATGAPTDIYVFDFASSTLSRLTSNRASGRPEWTPDGRRVVWYVNDGAKGTLWWQPWDKSAEAEVLLPANADTNKSPMGASFASSGTTFAYVTRGFQPLSDIGFASLADRKAQLIPAVSSPTVTETMPRISFDGKWLAYVSNESGVTEVYVRAFSGAGGRTKVSTDGGTAPMWAPGRLELFYVQGSTSRLISATISTTPELEVAKRDTVIPMTSVRGLSASWANYDVAKDGKSFLVVGGDAVVDRTIVVFNWLDELRERMKVAGKK